MPCVQGAEVVQSEFVTKHRPVVLSCSGDIRARTVQIIKPPIALPSPSERPHGCPTLPPEQWKELSCEINAGTGQLQVDNAYAKWAATMEFELVDILQVKGFDAFKGPRRGDQCQLITVPALPRVVMATMFPKGSHEASLMRFFAERLQHWASTKRAGRHRDAWLIL
eukprot:7016195-Karenia_brevis.AAC.1